MTHELALPSSTCVEANHGSIPIPSTQKDECREKGVWEMLLIVPSVTDEDGTITPKYLASHFGPNSDNPLPNQFPSHHGWKSGGEATVEGQFYFVVGIPCTCPNCTTITAEMLSHVDVEAY